MAIMGHVDGMEGSYAVGWAAAAPDTANCAITLVDEAGEIIAEGRASRHRPDLVSLGLGRTTLAFRIPLPGNTTPRRLRVLADGVELPGSPLQTGAGVFDGYCNVRAATLTGWVTERVEAAPEVLITVEDPHGEVGRAYASPEPTGNDPLFAPIQYAVPLADRCFGAGDVRLTVLANGVAFAKTVCNLPLSGKLEIISAQHCLGWLVCPQAPERAFEIEIFLNGARVASTGCKYPRRDLRELFPHSVTPGFSVELGAPKRDVMQADTLSLRLKGAKTELFEGPYVLASQPAAIAAAQRVAGLARRGLPGIGVAEQAALELAMENFLAWCRREEGFTAPRQFTPQPGNARRLLIIMPVYRGVAVTRGCIASVLAHRNVARDHLLLINDASPERDMAPMLAEFAGEPNLTLLHNAENLGFVRTVNRGLALADGADTLLLNADTRMFAGGLEELLRIADSKPDIGTVTAISNNATIFSYPHPDLRQAALEDIGWAELAACALAENAGVSVDVPTGHGFCMFIKNEVMQRIGLLDEAFGRGYGEENDFCARAAVLGYRHVAAGGVLVEHQESVSFEQEKASLLALNLPRLNTLYPEYTPTILAFERIDGTRALRWGLDRARLACAAAAGTSFLLLISNALEGGTARAIRDLEQQVGYDGAVKLSLRCTDNGLMELGCAAPLIRANFLPDETAELFTLLNAAQPSHVLVHQLLGFPERFITALTNLTSERHSVFYIHDFYAFCPRVTMLDAIGCFCDVADAVTCARCVEMGGAHEASVLNRLAPDEHRALFAAFLANMRHVIAPSANAGSYFRRAFPGLEVEILPHPETLEHVPAPRAKDDDEIILLGAIGAHKGSAMLLEIARRARLTRPRLRFHVIGHTNIDQELRATGNVTITGKFAPEALPGLLAQTRGRLALFLSPWPETYSYTLSEAARHGLIPLVPDIGAPAERVRAAQYGVIFAFPATAERVLAIIDDITAGRVQTNAPGAGPERLFPDAHSLARAAEFLNCL